MSRTMIQTSVPLQNYMQTIDTIKLFARRYADDVGEYARLSPIAFYNFLRGLPYIADPHGVETVSRPLFSLSGDAPRDCDDKTVIAGAYANLRRIPWRIVVAGKGTSPHHVYPELFLSGKFIPFDATYPERNFLGQRLYQPERFRHVIPGGG